MASLVLELQREAATHATNLPDVLRKARMVAFKLKLNKMNKWIENELNGYSADAELPRYRMLFGDVRAHNPFNGHLIPIRFEDSKSQEAISEVNVTQSIGELFDVYSGESDYAQFHFSEHTLRVLRPQLGEDFHPSMIPFRKVAKTQLAAIFDAVRNRILDWTLQLEAEGILGEGMTFTPSEQDKAKHSTSISIGSVGHFQGIMGNVEDSIVTQNLQMNVQKDDVESLKEFLRKQNVSEDDLTELERALKADPKPTTEGCYGGKVGGWMGKMVGKAASGTWKMGISVATNLIASAIKAYYGF